MSGEPGRAPGGRQTREGTDEEEQRPRPESGVFLSPQTSVDQSSRDTAKMSASCTDSGYHTSTSSSAADLEPNRATFYMDPAADTTEEPQADDFILLDHQSAATSPDDDDDEESNGDRRSDASDLERSGDGHPEVSRPLEIPGASSFHSAHDEAMHLMGGTPPRSYDTHPPAPRQRCPDPDHRASSGFGYHLSTGCLTNLPFIKRELSLRSGTPCGELLATGLRVTSGHLQASNRRADPQRKRTTSERVSRDDVTVARDRSLSAPDIGIQRQLVQRQCAQELRKISDEFFEEFHQRKGRTSRAGQSQPAHSSSYPGTSSIKHGLWQAIIQTLSPSAVRASSSPSSARPSSSSSSVSASSSSSSSRPLAETNSNSNNPRIVITKQESNEDSLRHQ